VTALCFYSVKRLCKRNSYTVKSVLRQLIKARVLDAERLQFLRMRASENLELGSNATVSCRAEGRVPPRLRWSRLDDEDRFGELPDDVYADGDGNLHFVKVRSSHAGHYQCVASSEQGRVTVNVSVEVVGTSHQFHSATVLAGLIRL